MARVGFKMLKALQPPQSKSMLFVLVIVFTILIYISLIGSNTILKTDLDESSHLFMQPLTIDKGKAGKTQKPSVSGVKDTNETRKTARLPPSMEIETTSTEPMPSTTSTVMDIENSKSEEVPSLSHDIVLSQVHNTQQAQNNSSSNVLVNKGDSYGKVFLERRKHLEKMCLKDGITQPGSLSDSNFSAATLVDVKHGIFYCPVQKVASTFWSRTLKAMLSNGQYNSPYTVRKTSLVNHKTLASTISPDDLKRLLNNGESLLAVRDPYTKLFSGYMDKLFHPNYLFWRTLGVPIKKAIRHVPDRSDLDICGDDITFAEYIKYIVYTYEHNLHLNRHFTTINEHCNLCTARYTYISHVETIKDDYLYIVNNWNTKYNLSISVHNFEGESARSIIIVHARLCFRTIRDFSEKFNIRKFVFLKRSWRFLQASGIISIKFSLPFLDDERAEFITLEQYAIAALSAVQQQGSLVEIKKQRKQAFVQAYQSVSLYNMFKLRKILRPDCQYFGYDDTPPELYYNNDTLLGDNEFNYFDV